MPSGTFRIIADFTDLYAPSCGSVSTSSQIHMKQSFLPSTTIQRNFSRACLSWRSHTPFIFRLVFSCVPPAVWVVLLRLYVAWHKSITCLIYLLGQLQRFIYSRSSKFGTLPQYLQKYILIKDLLLWIAYQSCYIWRYISIHIRFAGIPV